MSDADQKPDKGELTKEGVTILVLGVVAALAFSGAVAYVATGLFGEFQHMISHVPNDTPNALIVHEELDHANHVLYNQLVGLTFAAIVVWGCLGGYAAKRISTLTQR